MCVSCRCSSALQLFVVDFVASCSCVALLLVVVCVFVCLCRTTGLTSIWHRVQSDPLVLHGMHMYVCDAYVMWWSWLWRMCTKFTQPQIGFCIIYRHASWRCSSTAPWSSAAVRTVRCSAASPTGWPLTQRGMPTHAFCTQPLSSTSSTSSSPSLSPRYGLV